MNYPLEKIWRAGIRLSILVLILAQSHCGRAGAIAPSQFSPTTQTGPVIPGYTPPSYNNNTLNVASTPTSTYCEASGAQQCVTAATITTVGGQGFRSMGGCLQYMVAVQPDPALTAAQLNQVFSGAAMYLVQCFVNIGQAERVLTRYAISAAQTCLNQVGSLQATPTNWNIMGNKLAACLQAILTSGGNIPPPNLGHNGWER